MKIGNISTSEVLEDIAVTEAEIAAMKREAEGLALMGDRMSLFRRDARLTGIKDRENFIAKLKDILKGRGVAVMLALWLSACGSKADGIGSAHVVPSPLPGYTCFAVGSGGNCVKD